MKKPEKFEDFCETLTHPYSSAKQYFADIILRIDVYHDMTYFYDFFEALDSEKQDTVYCNILRLYDVTKEGKDDSSKRLTTKCEKLSKMPTLKSDMSDSEFLSNMDKAMKKISEIMDEYKIAAERDHKLTVLNQLLSTADSYRRNRSSVEISNCESKCYEHTTNISAVKKTQILVLYLMIAISALITIFINLGIVYIYSKIGSDSFVEFIEDNFWTVFIFPVVTAFLIWIGNKIINLKKEIL